VRKVPDPDTIATWATDCQQFVSVSKCNTLSVGPLNCEADYCVNRTKLSVSQGVMLALKLRLICHLLSI